MTGPGLKHDRLGLRAAQFESALELLKSDKPPVRYRDQLM
jgi:hypothetical protein